MKHSMPDSARQLNHLARPWLKTSEVTRRSLAETPRELAAGTPVLRGVADTSSHIRLARFAQGRLGCLLFATALLAGATLIGAEPTPLTCVHAHNDYEHKHPLFDALDHGFCSVEADIYLVNGQLLVVHNRDQVKPGRTLQSLYLDPLRARVEKNGGRVFRNGPEFTLLIDLKQDWRRIYPVLRSVLAQYADILTTFHDGKKHTRAITAIISGDRSLDMFTGESTRYACYDGGLQDLNSTQPADLIPWISTDWAPLFKWRGRGPFPAQEKARLMEILAKAHRYGRRVRFWGSPDKPVFWREMLNDGVDLINTDNLAGLQKFLEDRRQ